MTKVDPYKHKEKWENWKAKTAKGIQIEKEDKIELSVPKVCPRCNLSNESTNRFCKACGQILDNKEAEKIAILDLEKKESNDVMNELLDDPEILNLIRKKLEIRLRNSG